MKSIVGRKRGVRAVEKAIRYTPKELQTHKQETIIFDLNWVIQKKKQHLANMKILHGKRATTDGVRFFIRNK